MKEYEYTGKAMGTDFAISIICTSEETAQKLKDQAILRLKEYESIFSRFSPESELSKLNRDKAIEASPIFMKAILKAKELFLQTTGIFNPLVQIERLGYNKDFSQLKDTRIATTLEKYDLDFESIQIDKDSSKITLKENQKLDFGGFVKGYVAEIICREIKESSSDIQGVIVNIGGDIYTLGKDTKGEDFIFSIYNPITQKDNISLEVSDGGLATSGTYKRNWVVNEKKFHHILDVSGTKNPESNNISASVLHKDGGKADAYAKVFLSLRPTEARKILEDEDVSFIVIQNDGTIVKNIQ